MNCRLRHIIVRLTPLIFLFCLFVSPSVSADPIKENACQCAQVVSDTWNLFKSMDQEGRLNDPKIQAAYFQKITRIENVMDACLTNQECFDSKNRLALRRAKNLTDYMKTRLEKFKPIKACGQCETIALCEEACKEWKRQNDICRNRWRHYQKFAAMDATGLDCKEAIRDLKEYETGLTAHAPSRQEKDSFHTREEIEALLLTLYAILKTDDQACAKEGFKMIQEISLRSPGNFVTIFEELWAGLDDRSRQKIIEIVSQAKNSSTLYDMVSLVQILNKKDKREREVLIDLIGGLDRGQLASITGTRAIDLNKVMRIDYLMVTETRETLYPDKNIQTINQCMPELFARRLSLFNPAVSFTRLRPEALRSLSIGRLSESRIGTVLPLHDPPSAQKGDGALTILGGITKEASHYLIRLRFLSDTGLILFTKDIKIEAQNAPEDGRNMSRVCDILEEAIGNTLNDFRNFISIFQLFPGGRSLTGNTQAYIAHTALISNIETRIYRRKEALQSYDGVLIKKDFWESPQGDAVFGKSFHDRIFSRINANYFHTRLNALLLEEIRPGCMVVSGHFLRKPLETIETDGEEQEAKSAITLFFTNDDETLPLRKVTFLFPTASLADQKAVEAIKEEIEVIVAMTLADIFALAPHRRPSLVPEQEAYEEAVNAEPACPVSRKPATSPENQFQTCIRSFFIPGYARIVNGCSATAPVGIWAISNSILGGLSLGAAMYYINTDYEKEWSYTASSLLGYAFCINGAIGMIDAYFTNKPTSPSSGSACGVHLFWALNGPFLMVSHPF